MRIRRTTVNIDRTSNRHIIVSHTLQRFFQLAAVSEQPVTATITLSQLTVSTHSVNPTKPPSKQQQQQHHMAAGTPQTQQQRGRSSQPSTTRSSSSRRQQQRQGPANTGSSSRSTQGDGDVKQLSARFLLDYERKGFCVTKRLLQPQQLRPVKECVQAVIEQQRLDALKHRCERRKVATAAAAAPGAGSACRPFPQLPAPQRLLHLLQQTQKQASN